MRIFTPEQQGRLGVNKYGEHNKHGDPLGLGENAKINKHHAHDSTSEDTDDVPPVDDDSISSASDGTEISSASDDVAMPDDDPWPWK